MSYYTGIFLVGVHCFGVPFPKQNIFWKILVSNYWLQHIQKNNTRNFFLFAKFYDKRKFSFLQTVQSNRNNFRELQKQGRYQIKRKLRKCFEIKKQDAFQHEEGVFKISQSEGVLISIHLTNLQFDTLENLHRHFYHTCFVPTT